MCPDEATPPADSDGAEASPAPACPIVGVGASAGGLEALTTLLRNITIDSLAFVIVQHLARDHESLLPEILGRSSHMPVLAIADGMRVEPNRVYVAPPNASVALLKGVFHLMSPSAPLPIDSFFRSLAEDQGPRAIGVVLSGMGSDGAQGLREIKARGGLAFAQDPRSAKYDSMPSSAQETGVVDRILPPEGIASELMTVSKHPYLVLPPSAGPPASEREELGKVFILIRSAYGNDLSLYKASTINRRVARRMALHQIEHLRDYVRFLQDNRAELTALYRDVLISVTSFFRDVEPFEILERVILPRILERKGAAAPLRIWVPACASGEEAYSLGICVLELLEASAQGVRLQIFGTDVDEEAIGRARRGVYPPNIEADVSQQRLARFFVKTDEGYQVNRHLRDSIVFSVQNIAHDSPFSRIDLASCRNLLIYLQPALQKKVLGLLHCALVPDGVLLLGTSETVGDTADLFSLVDRKNKIYVKKNLPVTPAIDHRWPRDLARSAGPSAQEGERRGRPTAQQIADRKLVERYGPPSVLVSENLDVLQFRGDTGPYLSPSPGTATLNLLKLLRPELQVEVWRAAQQALASDTPSRVPPLRLTYDGPPGESRDRRRMVAVHVLPIHEPETRSRCLLMVFEDAGAAPESPSLPLAATGTGVEEERVRELEQELEATKEYLQTTIEELETSNEELKSTNEELQSTNEELQSTNEELETSKEELQSTNEELSTMNDELQRRLADLARMSSDLDNLLVSLSEPVLIVDAERRVRVASEEARQLLELQPADLGYPLSQLKARFVGIDVEQAVDTATTRLTAATGRACVGGRWHDVRTVPYRWPGGGVAGAMLLLRDVDVEVRKQELTLNVEQYAGKVLAAVPQPLAILDQQMRVLWVNKPFLTTFRVDAGETVGNLFQNLGSGQWAHPKLREAIEHTLASGGAFHAFRVEHDFESIGRGVVTVSGSVIRGISGTDRLMLITVVTQDAQGMGGS